MATHKISTPDNLEATFNFDSDKNRKQMRTEFVCRKLAAQLRGVTKEKLQQRKEDGIVSVGLVPLAMVEIVDQQNFEVKWNLREADRLQIDRPKVLEALRVLLADPATRVVWG